MRWNIVAALAAAFAGAALASPIKEDSSMAVAVAEAPSCDGSHYIVSVQRTDDVKQDSGELIAEKISNIVFDFKVDTDAENLLMNGYALKLVPQKVQKITFFAVVLASDQTVPGAEPGSVTSPELIEALNKLDRTGLITADVDLSIAYEGDVRRILIHVQVLELEGCTVSAKDVLAVQLALPRIEDGMGRHHGGHHRPHPQQKACDSGHWLCRVSNWFHSLGKPHHGCKGKGRQGSKDSGERHHHHHDGGHKHGDEHSGEHGDDHANHHGGYHRHRFNRPHHGIMRLIIHVVIPVVIGAAAGVGIGILSVFVAEIVGGVIMRVRGRRTTEYEIVDKDDDEGFEDALPVYEEGEMVPAYTEEKQ